MTRNRLPGQTLTLVLLAGGGAAQEKKEAVELAVRIDNGLAHTSHQLTIGKRTIRYTATAGCLTLRDEKGRATADVFHVAYVEHNADAAKRPVTFVFNGGPGSSSIWLHLGTVGPRRVALTEEGRPLPPPGRVMPCEESWLDVTDLVFIDPVGTGYSRPAAGHEQKEFSGLRADTASVGEFIRLWITKNRRWRSPKFLVGESYGTTRAASLAGWLQDEHRMYLNGIVLVSSVLNHQTIRTHIGNDLPHVLLLPSYAATAWYHKRLPETLQKKELPQLIAEVGSFALRNYLVALAMGDAMPEDARLALAGKLGHYTGLGSDYWLRSNLRVGVRRFAKELLRSERTTIGRLDSRLTGADRDAAGEEFEFDPSMAAIDGPFGQAFNDYVRRDLKYENDVPYRVMTDRVRPWSYEEEQNRYVNVGETLRRAMNRNRHLKLMVCSGYFDLATPFFGSDYTVAHLGLEPELRNNIRVRYYEAGHMMYIHGPSRRRLKKDVSEFYQSALARE